MNKYKLKDVCYKIYSGGTPSTKENKYWNGSIPWLSSSESGQDFVYKANSFITEIAVEETSTKFVSKNTVVMATAGEGKTRGQVCYLKIDACISQSMIALEVDKNKIDSLFLFYYLKNSYSRIRSLSDATGVRGSLSGSLLKEFYIFIPELEKQKKISDLLYKLDKKIQNNNKQIQTLESLAKTIYDYWFVQFDFPNEDGRPYKSSGGKMVWNEELKREIPEGWKYTFIGSITNCYDSKRVPLSSKQRGAKKGEFPYYGATCVMDYVNEFIFDGDYVLMAEDGSIMKVDNTPILQRITGKTWVNNHAHILEPKKGYSCAVLMQLLKDIYVPSLKTGSIQAKITQEKMNSIKIIDIPSDLLYEINKQLLPLDSKVLHLQNEISVLNKLKGFILPLLMNGQVSVNV